VTLYQNLFRSSLRDIINIRHGRGLPLLLDTDITSGAPLLLYTITPKPPPYLGRSIVVGGFIVGGFVVGGFRVIVGGFAVGGIAGGFAVGVSIVGGFVGGLAGGFAVGVSIVSGCDAGSFTVGGTVVRGVKVSARIPVARTIVGVVVLVWVRKLCKKVIVFRMLWILPKRIIAS
jgi:hypothetical protein